MKIRIYTDGACSGNPGPGGWAGIIFFPNQKQIISGFEPETTNNRMELKAAVEAIKLVMEMGYSKIDLYSDSAYVVNAIKMHWVKKWQMNGWRTVSHDEVKNKDLWIKLISMIEKHDINFIKVKGHSDNEHNNQCDKIAKREIERRKEA
jgi:ribonuclease HI